MSEILTAALEYVESGFSVLPLHGKQPATRSWARLQVQRPALSHVHEWHRRGYLHNVGIICGAVSRNLVVIDLDGPDAVNEFRRQFADRLPVTRVVRTGSGEHWYYFADQLPTTTRTKGFELRANGCYVVAPPSIHPTTGQPYQIISDSPIARRPSLESVREWIMSRITAKQGQGQRQPVRTGNRTIGWWDRALIYEIRAVAAAPVGQRSNTLNRAAYNLGQIVGDRLLDRARVERDLLDAALAAGLGEVEAQRTIRSGLEAGIAEPRSQQWRKRTS